MFMVYFPEFDRLNLAFDRFVPAFDRFSPAGIPVTLHTTSKMNPNELNVFEINIIFQLKKISQF